MSVWQKKTCSFYKEMELHPDQQCPASLIACLAKFVRYSDTLSSYPVHTIQFDCFQVFGKIHLKCSSLYCYQY